MKSGKHRNEIVGINALNREVQLKRQDEHLARLKNFDAIQKMLVHLPLSYLYSKPELRLYSYERAFGSFMKLCRLSIRSTYKDVWRKWKCFKHEVNNESIVIEEITELRPQFTSEKKFGIMVIAALFTEMGKKLLKRKLDHWAKCYSSKYNPKAV